MHKITYNSWNVDKIYAKIDAGIHLRPPIRVPNFSKIKARTHELWRFLQSVRNDEEEKNEKIFYEILLTHISRTA